MTEAQTIWLAGIFIASITINSSIVKILSDKGINHPNIVGGIINSLMSLIGGFFGYIVLNIIVAIIFVAFNLFSFLFIVIIITRRDVRALNLSHSLLSSFRKFDLQIIEILDELHNGASESLFKSIRRAQRWSLYELSNILGLDKKDNPQLCILVPENNRFKTIAYEGIENFRIAKMEEVFRYGAELKSLAGLAMNQRRTILINDLTDKTNEDVKQWIQVLPTDERDGSILIYPIIRGLGNPDAEPISIVCVSSTRKNSFDKKDVAKIMVYYSPKIEILQNCWEIAEGMETVVK